jgi:hypothetical protein
MIIEVTPITVVPCPSAAYKYSYHLVLSSHLELLHFFPGIPHFSPLNHNGSQVRDQALTRLCECIFIFIERNVYAAVLPNSIFTTISLFFEGLIPRATIPNA